MSNAKKQALQGLSILVTRPEHQADEFCLMLKNAGAKPVRLPTLKIEETTQQDHTLRLLKQVDQQNIIIFTSSNAVEFASGYMDSLLSSQHTYTVAAIGKKTTQALQKKNIHVDIQPEKYYNSESLLALADMRQVKNKRILIIKGEGGRTLLGDTLKARGAIVEHANVYVRRCPTLSDHLLNTLKSEKIDIITLTSAESSENLLSLLSDQPIKWLTNATLLLGSQRIYDVIASRQTLSDNPHWIAENPSDDAMFAALLALSEHRKRNTTYLE